MKRIKDDEGGSFDLSTGDLMASILIVFILLLVSTMMKLQDEFDKKSSIAENYKALRVDLYNDLYNEFQDDLIQWDAVIDSSLAIRFNEPEVLFDAGSSSLKPQFKEILENFFPRYIRVLYNHKYREHIEEIRIEGHTSVEGRYGMNEENAYFYNMRLSQDRTRSVLRFCLEGLNAELFNWSKEHSTANGLSSVKPLAKNDTEIGRKQNRRVEFRVKTDAEKQLINMLEYGEK